MRLPWLGGEAKQQSNSPYKKNLDLIRVVLLYLGVGLKERRSSRSSSSCQKNLDDEGGNILDNPGRSRSLDSFAIREFGCAPFYHLGVLEWTPFWPYCCGYSCRRVCLCEKRVWWMLCSNTKFQRCARPLKVVAQGLPKISRLPSTTPTCGVLVNIFVAVRHVLSQCRVKFLKNSSSFFFSRLLG